MEGVGSESVALAILQKPFGFSSLLKLIYGIHETLQVHPTLSEFFLVTLSSQ